MATRHDNSLLTCQSPATPLEPVGAGDGPLDAFTLEVALNARDFSTAGVAFSYFEHPQMLHIHPTAGPACCGLLPALHFTMHYLPCTYHVLLTVSAYCFLRTE